jgi:hypothetical protein
MFVVGSGYLLLVMCDAGGLMPGKYAGQKQQLQPPNFDTTEI